MNIGLAGSTGYFLRLTAYIACVQLCGASPQPLPLSKLFSVYAHVHTEAQNSVPNTTEAMAVVHSFHPTPVTSAPFEPLDIHPQITAKALLRASDKDKKALVDIHELLHRLFVRNRNQHRRNHWFKSLHQFRKQLGLLLNEMDSSKKASIASKLEQRLQVWDNRYIHQWYLLVNLLIRVIVLANMLLQSFHSASCLWTIRSHRPRAHGLYGSRLPRRGDHRPL